MPNNCFIKELKAGVINDNLPVSNKLKIGFVAASNGYVLVKSDSTKGDVLVTVLNGTVSSVVGNDAQLIDSTHVKINGDNGTGSNGFKVDANAQVNVEIDNFYALKGIAGVFTCKELSRLNYSEIVEIYVNAVQEFDINHFWGCKTLQNITLAGTMSNYKGDFSVFESLTGLKTFVCQQMYANQNVSIGLSAFKNKADLESLDLRNAYPASWKAGDIKLRDLGACTKLTNLWLQGTPVSGSVEEFVILQRFDANNPRPTCTGITVGAYMGTDVTFDGVQTSTMGSIAKTLSWAPNSNVSTNTDVTYNEVTVTIDENGNKVE